jgi:hypothetical protein
LKLNSGGQMPFVGVLKLTESLCVYGWSGGGRRVCVDESRLYRADQTDVMSMGCVKLLCVCGVL